MKLVDREYWFAARKLGETYSVIELVANFIGDAKLLSTTNEKKQNNS